MFKHKGTLSILNRSLYLLTVKIPLDSLGFGSSLDFLLGNNGLQLANEIGTPRLYRLGLILLILLRKGANWKGFLVIALNALQLRKDTASLLHFPGGFGITFLTCR